MRIRFLLGGTTEVHIYMNMMTFLDPDDMFWTMANSNLWFVANVALLIVSPGVAANLEPFHRQPSEGRYLGPEWGIAGTLQRQEQERCIDIPETMPLCKDVGYSKMRFPNLLGHETMADLDASSSAWVPLIEMHCHPDARMFVCSLYAPVCLDRPVLPCHSLCENVRDVCGPEMLVYGFPWPEVFNCDKIPTDNDLCIKLKHNVTDNRHQCDACVAPENITYQATVDRFCASDLVLRSDIKEHSEIYGSDLKVIPKKKKKLISGNVKKRILREMTFLIKDGATCKCDVMEDLENGGEQTNRQYLVMGSLKRRIMTVTFLIHLDFSVRDIRRAWRAMKRGKTDPRTCPNPEAIPSAAPTPRPTQTNTTLL